MAADKRSFIEFASFDGKINHDRNLYEFPTLYKVADSGKVRQWTVYVRLIKEGSKAPRETKKQNWNMLEEDEVPIKAEYLADDSKLPAGIVSQIWTETGLVGGHISRAAATYPKPKNQGRANERNYFHQALIQARSKYLKKIDDGSVKKNQLNSQHKIKLTKGFYYPMLARQYADYVDKPASHKDAIRYPLYVQPKLNGSRMLAFLDPKHGPKSATYTDVVLYTRQQKLYPDSETNNQIRKSLLNALIKSYDTKHNESIYIDGEIYCHGMALQDIGSDTRASKSDARIQYWIYDCFYPSWTTEPFKDRIETLKELYDILTKSEQKDIILTPTYLINTPSQGDTAFAEALDDGYEGIMYRACDGPYAKSAIKKSTALRSKSLLKRKNVIDGEYEIVGYTQGRSGTSRGALIWICQTVDGQKFNVTPNMSNEERYKLFKECQTGSNFIKKYNNRMVSVEYRELTKSGKPSQAKAIGFRDYE